MIVLNDKQLINFYDKVEFTTDCWEWKGHIMKNGYGQFGITIKRVLSHRLSYELHKGDIPLGLTIDHLCKNKKCVNPDHLEAVTLQENIRRGDCSKHQKNKTRCKYGHPYDDKNTYYKKSGGRDCKQCIKNRNNKKERFDKLG